MTNAPPSRARRMLRPVGRFTLVAAALAAGCANAPDAPPGVRSGAVRVTDVATVGGAIQARPTRRTLSAVTLITGDVVQLAEGGGAPAAITTVPAPGREQVTFGARVVERAGGEDVIVVPSDAAPLLAS